MATDAAPACEQAMQEEFQTELRSLLAEKGGTILLGAISPGEANNSLVEKIATLLGPGRLHAIELDASRPHTALSSGQGKLITDVLGSIGAGVPTHISSNYGRSISRERRISRVEHSNLRFGKDGIAISRAVPCLHRPATQYRKPCDEQFGKPCDEPLDIPSILPAYTAPAPRWQMVDIAPCPSPSIFRPASSIVCLSAPNRPKWKESTVPVYSAPPQGFSHTSGLEPTNVLARDAPLPCSGCPELRIAPPCNTSSTSIARQWRLGADPSSRQDMRHDTYRQHDAATVLDGDVDGSKNADLLSPPTILLGCSARSFQTGGSDIPSGATLRYTFGGTASCAHFRDAAEYGFGQSVCPICSGAWPRLLSARSTPTATNPRARGPWAQAPPTFAGVEIAQFGPNFQGCNSWPGRRGCDAVPAGCEPRRHTGLPAVRAVAESGTPGVGEFRTPANSGTLVRPSAAGSKSGSPCTRLPAAPKRSQGGHVGSALVTQVSSDNPDCAPPFPGGQPATPRQFCDAVGSSPGAGGSSAVERPPQVAPPSEAQEGESPAFLRPAGEDASKHPAPATVDGGSPQRRHVSSDLETSRELQTPAGRLSSGAARSWGCDSGAEWDANSQGVETVFSASGSRTAPHSARSGSEDQIWIGGVATILEANTPAHSNVRDTLPNTIIDSAVTSRMYTEQIGPAQGKRAIHGLPRAASPSASQETDVGVLAHLAAAQPHMSARPSKYPRFHIGDEAGSLPLSVAGDHLQDADSWPPQVAPHTEGVAPMGPPNYSVYDLPYSAQRANGMTMGPHPTNAIGRDPYARRPRSASDRRSKRPRPAAPRQQTDRPSELARAGSIFNQLSLGPAVSKHTFSTNIDIGISGPQSARKLDKLATIVNFQAANGSDIPQLAEFAIDKGSTSSLSSGDYRHF